MHYILHNLSKHVTIESVRIKFKSARFKSENLHSIITIRHIFQGRISFLFYHKAVDIESAETS